MAGEGQKQASRSPQPPAAAQPRPAKAGRRRESARSAFTFSLFSLSPFAQRVKGHVGEHAPSRAQRRVGHGL